jgi:hypothetical protein
LIKSVLPDLTLSGTRIVTRVESITMNGLCECGCGQPTSLAPQNHARLGYVKGEPKRFVTGHHIRTAKTLEQAFQQHFVIGAPGECWEWQGPLANTGYGRVSLSGERILAHRASYIIHYGEIGDGLEVCHTCYNHPCVNPEHLFEGTHADNMADMRHKGRSHPGALTGGAKLSDDIVRIIRLERAAGVLQEEVASRHGVTRPLISMIENYRIWKHVE